MRKEVRQLDFSDLSMMTPSLRAICEQPIPKSVQHVVMASVTTFEAKVLFNLVCHALGIADMTAAARSDLQRLQLLSQWLVAAEAYAEGFKALKCHGLALLLFPPLASRILQTANKARGRTASSSRRNALAHFGAAAMAVFRWLHVPESLRLPLLDCQAQERSSLERAARLTRRERSQGLLLTEPGLERPNTLALANTRTLKGKSFQNHTLLGIIAVQRLQGGHRPRVTPSPFAFTHPPTHPPTLTAPLTRSLHCSNRYHSVFLLHKL